MCTLSAKRSDPGKGFKKFFYIFTYIVHNMQMANAITEESRKSLHGCVQSHGKEINVL
jgi:hypothetical protein